MKRSNLNKDKIAAPLSMRRIFADSLLTHMRTNKRIWIVTGDLGYRMWDPVRLLYPTRFLNVGAAEQAMLGIAVGLALSGQIPVVYSITPFLLYRPFETIRNYLEREQIGVKLVGAGRDKDYVLDGPSHWAREDRQVMQLFPHISSYWPTNISEIPKLVNNMLQKPKPWYINLTR